MTNEHSKFCNKTKIFGERHTATGALSYFIQQNFEAKLLGYEYLGWKHRLAPNKAELSRQSKDSTLFIITIKHPVVWAIAMHRAPYNKHQPYLKQLPFETFLKVPIEDYESVLHLFNQKYNAWLQMAFHLPNSVFIQQETLAKDQQAIYKILSKQLKPRGDFIPLTKYVNAKGCSNTPYQHRDMNLSDLSSNSLKTCKDILDPKLLNILGYKL